MKQKLLPLLAIALLCLALAGCDRAQSDTPPPDTDVSAVETTPETEVVKTVYRVEYQSIRYLPDAAKEAWREPLVRLFSDEEVPKYDKSGGDPAAESDRPRVKRGYHISLFDINVDGVPELLIDLGGGSAGNAYYEVYDLYTGVSLGHMDGGHGDAWCLYYNTASGLFETIGQYRWRVGWQGRTAFVHKVRITEALSTHERVLCEDPLFELHYRLEAFALETTATGDYEYSGWNEECNYTSFYVNDSRVSIDTYHEAYDDFLRTRVRLPETAMQQVNRFDYEDDIERLVDDLLALNQKFIQPTAPKPVETEVPYERLQSSD